MYKRILVPLDGSSLAEGVLPYVRTLAKGLKARVTLLQVLDPEALVAYSDPAHGRYIDKVEAGAKAGSLDYLRKVGKTLEREAASVDYLVHAHTGDVPADIVDEAARQPDTLVAISTHGRSGLGRWLLGSVADKVLHANHTPLLLVRSTETAQREGSVLLKTAVVPLDGSPLAEGVLPHVTALAKAMGMEVILIRVVQPLVTYYGIPDYPPLPESLSVEMEVEATNYLRQAADKLRKQGVARVQSKVLHGFPAAQIIDFAQETQDNLVAISTHGRSGIGRWLLGSVTERVVRHSGDPVLVIRPDEAGGPG